MSSENQNLIFSLRNWQAKKSFWIRFLTYIPEYILWLIIWGLGVTVFIYSSYISGKGVDANILTLFGPPTLIIIFTEVTLRFRITNLRKKQIYDNFLNGKVNMLGIPTGDTYTSTPTENNKSDIGYWYELFEKGAITEGEYNKKKEELL